MSNQDQLRAATEIVCNEVQLIDACGQVCVDADSIRRGVEKAMAPFFAESEALTRLQRNLDLIGLCPKCAGSHHGRHEGACDGPPRAELPPHKMMG